MSEVQETETERKQERIEKPQVSSSKTRKVYVLGVAFVAVLLLGTSFGLIFSATTPSIPTVIEPGSNVIGPSYVIFKDGLSYYARNGTTGSIDYFSTNALTMLDTIQNMAPAGGTIYLGPGNYTLASPFIIDKPDLTFIGSGSTHYTVMPKATSPTTLYGDIQIMAENVRMETLNIGGKLNITSNSALTAVGHWLRFTDVCVWNGMEGIGLVGSLAWTAPFLVIFEGGEIRTTQPGPTIRFYSPTYGSVDHFTFIGVTIYGYDGDVVSICGYSRNIQFTNSIFMLFEAEQTLLNITQAALPDSIIVGFTQCLIELNAANCVIVSIGPTVGHDSDIAISFIGGTIQFWVAGLTPYLVKNYIQSNSWGNSYNEYDKFVLFDSVYFMYSAISGTGGLRFYDSNCDDGTSYAFDSMPKVLPKFVNCFFQPGMSTVTQTGTLQDVGLFVSCQGLIRTGGSVGIIAAPFYGGGPIGTLTIAHANGSTAPTNNTIYFARDMAYMVSSTGGTGVSITILDLFGGSVLSGASTLTRQLLPFDYSIQWTYTTPPTIVIEGI